MPIRERRRRRHVLELTRARAIALEIGPEQRDLNVTPLETLHDTWKEHRAKFGPNSWASMYWERGVDLRLADAYDPDAPSGCPGCDD
jgi:hypothetical protein